MVDPKEDPKVAVSSKNMEKDMIKKITLCDLNPHVVCVLCGGYFIDPVTIVECLHSFCKSCIVKHVEISKLCPICDVQIHKTRPFLSMRMDKTLQNIVYKLVPGLYQDEMERRRKFQEKNEPTKVSKEELEKHFFFRDDKISMSLEYFDPQKSTEAASSKANNPNKRYLACPGTVKIQHLMKFITMKYGLNDHFVVDVIYKGDLIPTDYTLIDVAYYYKWEKDSPMQFFYRIFKKNKVLLKRRKRKNKAEDKIGDGKKPRPVDCAATNDSSKPSYPYTPMDSGKNGSGQGSSSNNNNHSDIIGCRTVPAKSETKQEVKDEKPEKLLKQEITTPKIVNKVEAKTETAPPPEKKPKLDIAAAKDSAITTSTTTTPTTTATTKEDNNIKLVVSASDIKKVPEVKGKTSDSAVVKSAASPKTLSGLDLLQSDKKATSDKPKSPVLQRPLIRNLKPHNGQNILTAIVNNLAKKQKSQQQNSSESSKQEKTAVPLPATIHGGQTTITKRLVEGSSNSKAKTPPPTSTSTTTATSTTNASNTSSDVTASKLTKSIPSGTTITVKQIASTTTSSTPTSSSASVATTASMKNFVQASSVTTNTSSSIKKSSTVSDLRQFRKGGQVSEAAAPSKTTTSTRTPIIPSLTSRTLTLGGSNKVKMSLSAKTSTSSSASTSSSYSALSKPIPKHNKASLSANNALAGFTFEQQKAAMQQMQLLRIPLGANVLSSAATPPSSLTSQQLPSNRLQLKVQSTTSSSAAAAPSASSLSTASSHSLASSLSGFSAPFSSSLYSHMAAESLWKKELLLHSSLASAGMNGSGTASAKLTHGLSKTLNQGIRQIPNPSLLTKQTNEQQVLQQQQQLARAIMATAAANAAAARTSTSQQ